MWRAWLCMALMSILPATDLAAGERSKLGYGVLFSNDELGDGQDRWRTGSVSSSRIWGPAWTGRAPERLGQLLELRFNGQILSAESLTRPPPTDRRYAGALSLGLHSHAAIGAYDLALGADLVGTGPATRLDHLQDLIHDVLSGPQVSNAVASSQIPDGLHLRGVAEIGRDVAIGSGSLRPFAELHLGVETLARAGFDLTFGPLANGELRIRDGVTGQRYRVVKQEWSGFSYVFGADLAHVENSIFLPSGGAAVLKDTRWRARAGVHWQGTNNSSLFYGLTWLGEEFESQRETQFLGSLQFSIQF